MDVIQASELGVPNNLALRVLAHAQATIAPNLQNDHDAGTRELIVAVLQGVASEAQQRGLRSVTAQRIGPASVNYGDAASWFTDDDRETLRVLCGGMPASSAPTGHFPRPAPVVTRLWPERYDD